MQCITRTIAGNGRCDLVDGHKADVDGQQAVVQQRCMHVTARHTHGDRLVAAESSLLLSRKYLNVVESFSTHATMISLLDADR